MENITANIDEYGTESLNFDNPNNSTHFIISSILINNNNIVILENQVETIRSSNFQKGEMKSSSVGANSKRRIKILNEIKNLDFKIYSLIVDKREITSQGLKNWDVFYKYFNRYIYDDLVIAHKGINIFVDEIKRKPFMDAFLAYLKKHSQTSLFDNVDYKFSKSKSNLLIQLADFITGTLGHIFDENKKTENTQEMLEILIEKIILLNLWPDNFKTYSRLKDNISNDFDEEIIDLSIKLSIDFIEKNLTKRNPTINEQVQVLKYLLFKFRIDTFNFIYGDELVDYLSLIRNEKTDTNYLMRNIISKLRDENVLIASSSKGYKLPAKIDDLSEYIEYTMSQIRPRLSRMSNYRKMIKLASLGKIDIFKKNKFEELLNNFDKSFLNSE